MFGWFVCHSLLFQNNGEKMGENMLLVKISKRFQECSPFLEGKVPATISVTHPLTLSACLLSFLEEHCTTSTKILSSTGSSCTAQNCNQCLLSQTTGPCCMVLLFNNEKTDVIWEVHVSKDAFFTPLPLLEVLEGTSLPVTFSIHRCVIPLSDLLATHAARSRSLMPNGKRNLSFY